VANGRFVDKVFPASPGNALLVFSGGGGESAPEVVELRGDRAFAWRCNPSVASGAVAAFPLEGGWRIVEAGADFADLPSARCKPANAALIRAE